MFNYICRRFLTTKMACTEIAEPPLTYKVFAECSTTKARVGVMKLRHSDVDTPVFMPVGTQVYVLKIILDYMGCKLNPYVLCTGYTKRNPTRSIREPKLSDYTRKYVSFRNATGMHIYLIFP